jgi:ribosomal protein S18 acetylase RimI-like enzyme
MPQLHPNATIRRAAPADVDAIATMHLASWLAAYRGLISDEYLDRVTHESRVARWERTFTPEEAGVTETTLAVEGDNILGLCSFGPMVNPLATTMGEIYSLHIDPDTWRGGIGRMLLDDALLRLANRGFERVVLWVLRDNENARRFYEARGWSVTGEERDEDRSGYSIPETRFWIGLPPSG